MVIAKFVRGAYGLFYTTQHHAKFLRQKHIMLRSSVRRQIFRDNISAPLPQQMICYLRTLFRRSIPCCREGTCQQEKIYIQACVPDHSIQFTKSFQAETSGITCTADIIGNDGVETHFKFPALFFCRGACLSHDEFISGRAFCVCPFALGRRT